jgi:hypothetical protein
LIDVVINHLHGDKESLKACSLVCKTWTSSARFHLFSGSNVHVGDIKRLSESGRAVIWFIRHLRLYGRHWDNTLPPLVEFESIRSLTVTDLPAHWLDAQALSALFHNLSAAVNVRLDDVSFATVGQLICFICAFPCLHRLAVDCNCIRSSEFGVDLPTSSLSPHLRVLELNSIFMDAVLDWFFSLPDRPALLTVGLHPMNTSKSETITKLLFALENSLESFLISTAIANGMFVIFLNMIYAACHSRIALAIRPTPQYVLTLGSNQTR